MTNKLIYFFGNWKMFGSLSSISIINKLNHFMVSFKKAKRLKIIFFVPNTLIYFFAQKNKSKFVSIGAQNCHHKENSGPFTGSINASMLKNVGAKYTLIGHSDNRKEGDTDSMLKDKVKFALKNNLKVVFCIGENKTQKKNKKTFSVLKKQLTKVLEKNFNKNNIIIAYEPIWSIGTGKLPTRSELVLTTIHIKTILNKIFRKNIPPVLYGGSVDDKNIKFFEDIRVIDGFLIGGASKSSKKFIDIIKKYYK